MAESSLGQLEVMLLAHGAPVAMGSRAVLGLVRIAPLAVSDVVAAPETARCRT